VNKPIAQLELIKSEPTSGVETKAYLESAGDAVAAGPDPDAKLRAMLENIGVAPDAIERVIAASDPVDDFDWHEDDAVVVKPRPAIAVYQNKYEQVVIRTEARWSDGPDDFVYIAPESVPALIKALKEYLP
jgi:hypothetical protein